MAWGGECVVDGQIAGWYKGNEGGEELARCGGAVGWGWRGGAAPRFLFLNHTVAATGRYLTKSLGHQHWVYTWSIQAYHFTSLRRSSVHRVRLTPPAMVFSGGASF